MITAAHGRSGSQLPRKCDFCTNISTRPFKISHLSERIRSSTTERWPQCCGAVGCPPREGPVGLVARRPISAWLYRTPANMFATVQNRGRTGTVLVVSSPPTIICAQNVMSFRALFPNGEKAEKSAFGASSEAKRDARAESCSVTVPS